MPEVPDTPSLVASLKEKLERVSIPLAGNSYSVTALLSLLLVVLVVYMNPRLFTMEGPVRIVAEKWWDIAVWGGTLIVIAYAMGTLYEKKQAQIQELRDTYKGIMVILRQMTAHDKYTHDHSFRVAAYATTIAKCMGFEPERVEDIWDASLLHDLGKLETSREILYKAARFTAREFEEMKKHVEKGVQQIEPVKGRLYRIIPIILAHHDRFDGSGYRPTKGEDIPVEARVIAVADVYDAMISDRPYAKAMSPLEAKEIISKAAGKDFDPAVVRAFLKVFQSGSLQLNFAALDMVRA